MVLLPLQGEESVSVGLDEEAMVLDTEECLKLLLLLRASTCILPPSQREVKGFKVIQLQDSYSHACVCRYLKYGKKGSISNEFCTEHLFTVHVQEHTVRADSQ